MKFGDQVYRWMTPAPFTVTRDTGLAAAHETMRRHEIRHLPILDEGDLVGVVDERDLAIAERFPEAQRMAVGEIMSPEPYAVHPSTPLAEVAGEMAKRRHGVAIVVAKGHVVGVFTAVDGLRALAEDQNRRLLDEPQA